jgi:hypothetical protein
MMSAKQCRLSYPIPPLRTAAVSQYRLLYGRIDREDMYKEEEAMQPH